MYLEWRLRDAEQKAEQAISKLYMLDTLHSDVGSLERAIRENSSIIAGLRHELDTANQKIEQLERIVGELMLDR